MYYLRAQLTEGAHVYSFHHEWLFAACTAKTESLKEQKL